MKILDDLLSILNPEAGVRDIRQGIFHTGVLTRNCGLAATLPRDALQQAQPSVKEPGFLLEKPSLELAQMAYSESIPEAAIGMATINSLLDIDEERCLNLNASDLIAEKGEGKRVAIIGHFPFTPKLREVAKALWVIEKNPQEGDFTEAAAENLIPQADVVGITGSAFTNHTVEHLLELCNPRAYIVVLGATTPLSPVLFDYGVSAISGTKVINPELALRCVSEGATFRQIKGIRLLTMIGKEQKGGEKCLTDLVEDSVLEGGWGLAFEAALHPGPMSVEVEEDCRGVAISSVEPLEHQWPGHINRLLIPSMQQHLLLELSQVRGKDGKRMIISVASGKGGTGKTSIVGSFTALAQSKVLADCDVDAADLHLLLQPVIQQKHEFWSGQVAVINAERCTQCSLCQDVCHFDAINDFKVDSISCEGCGFCFHICPDEAIIMGENLSGRWFISEIEYGPLIHARLGIAQGIESLWQRISCTLAV